jgi:beta-lactamase regulating signal transducer with metallopeptidase domain
MTLAMSRPELWLYVGWTMVHFLWIGALIGGGAMLTLEAMRRASAAARYTAGVACFAVLALAPAVVFAVLVSTPQRMHDGPRQATAAAIADPSAAQPSSRGLGVSPEHSRGADISTQGVTDANAFADSTVSPTPVQPRAPQRWSLTGMIPLLPRLWLIGAGAMLLWSAAGLAGAERLRRCATGAADPRLVDRCRTLAAALRIVRPIALHVCDRIASPVLIGILRPAILLPPALLSGLTPRQIEMVLLHELAHVRRWDNLVNLFQRVVESLLFFHPSVWVLSARIRREREHACDDLVLRHARCGDDEYVQTLLLVAQSARPASIDPAPWASAAMARGDFASRVGRLLAKEEPMRVSLPVTYLFTFALLAGVAGAWWIAPSRAQQPATTPATASTIAPQPDALPPASGIGEIGFRAGPVLTVSKDAGAKYSSIQAAVDAAPARAIIEIGPGVYDEAVIIRKPLHIRGAGWQQTTIRLPNGRRAAWEQAVADAERDIRAGKTDADVEKALLKLQDQFKAPAVVVDGAEGVELAGVKITEASPVTPDDGGLRPNSLLRIDRAKAWVHDCALIGGTGNGVIVGTGAEAAIERSLVAAVWNTGIVVSSGREQDAKPARARILNCDIRNNYYAGVTAGYRDDVTIERCRISGSAWHGVRSAGPIVVRNNIIFGNVRCGIYADAGEQPKTIENNLFLRNQWTGIWCLDLNVDRVTGNTFAYNGREAFVASGGAKPVVERNVFFANEMAISCGKINGNRPTNQLVGDPKLVDNMFWQNKKLMQVATDDEKNPLKDVKPSGDGNSEADPKFADPEKNDFAMSADSPASKLKAGATNLPAVESPYPVTPEEKAIVPDGPERDSNLWKRPKA